MQDALVVTTLGKIWALDAPSPQFQQFERIEIADAPSYWAQFNGEQGVVICAGYFHKGSSHLWSYSVYLPQQNRCPSFKSEWLKSAGSFDTEADHLGQRPEVSFDIVLGSDNDWVEGTYRLPGEFWKVLIFRKRDVPEIQHELCEWLPPTTWQPISEGIVFRVPKSDKLDRDYLFRALSAVFGPQDWVEVNGPDSFNLR